MLDDKHDILIECYNFEDVFLDINEVFSKKDNYEVVGNNRNIRDKIEHIILPKKTVTHIGDNYQAKIPVQTKFLTDKRSLCRIWNPDNIKEELLEQFLEQLSDLTKIESEDLNEEKAVEILSDNNFDATLALKFCYQNLSHIRKKILTKQKKYLL